MVRDQQGKALIASCVLLLTRLVARGQRGVKKGFFSSSLTHRNKSIEWSAHIKWGFLRKIHLLPDTFRKLYVLLREGYT